MKGNTLKVALGASLLAVGVVSNVQAGEVHYGYTSLPSANAARVSAKNNFSENKLVAFHPGYWSSAKATGAKISARKGTGNQNAQIVQIHPGVYSLPTERDTRNEGQGLTLAQSSEPGDF